MQLSVMWKVEIDSKIRLDVLESPLKVQEQLALLLRDLARNGPVRGNWPNYSKLAPHRHHCHLKKGHPTYVAVWEDSTNGIKLIEVTYVGTHSRAPY